MGVFNRFGRVIKAHLNQLLTKAEEPEKMLNQLVNEMTEQLIESKKSVAGAIADEKRFERRVHEHHQKAEEWEGRAILALTTSEKEPDRREYYEDLARKALTQQKECNVLAEKYREQVRAQHDSVEKLKIALGELQQRIEDARQKKNLLIARAKRAEAQKKIQEHISGLADTSAFDAFEKMAGRVEQIEAETDAIAHLETSKPTLEQEFNLLEEGETDQKMLDDLRERMTKGEKNTHTPPDTASANASASSDPEVDAMMKELKKKLDT